MLLKKEKGKRIQCLHNNKQRTTKQKAKKRRNQEAMLREFHLWCDDHSTSLSACGVLGQGLGSSLQEGVSHTYTLRLI